jgi:hypothetical protein
MHVLQAAATIAVSTASAYRTCQPELCWNAVASTTSQQSDALMANTSAREAVVCATLVLLVLVPHLTDAKLRCTVHRSTSNTAYVATLSTDRLLL